MKGKEARVVCSIFGMSRFYISLMYCRAGNCPGLFARLRWTADFSQLYDSQSFACLGKTPPDGRLAVNNMYVTIQSCRDHVTLAGSCAADDARISLRTIGDRQASLSRMPSYNVSHTITDHPQSSWISCIELKQPTNRVDVDILEDTTSCDEVTELKAFDERRHDCAVEQERRETDTKATVYNKSQCEVVSQVDSGNSSLTTSSREENDNKTPKSEVIPYVVTPTLSLR